MKKTHEAPPPPRASPAADEASRTEGNQRPWLISDEDQHALVMRLARKAQLAWRQVPVAGRARKLERLAVALLDRMDEVTALIHEENGKPPVEAIGHEIAASVAAVRWLCEKGRRALEREAVPMPWLPHRRATIEREPLGLVLIISPWNFPLSIPLGQTVAALLAGNAVVLKPSEVTPRCGALIEDLLDACSLPPNIFQLVQGDGQLGAKLIDLRPDKLLFTGSLVTGRKVMEAAARFPIPVSLELGGVDALIVLEDADMELASSAAVWGGFFNTGQVCASVERLLVHHQLRDAFLARVLEKTAALEPSADLSIYTADKQRQVYQRQLDDAQTRNLELLCGGHWLGPRLLAPTILTGEGIGESDVYREESFGPFIAVQTFRTDAEAASLHNALWGGLTASIFCADEARAYELAKELDAGLVSVNDVAATLHAAPELPWGGVGGSGFGRSHGVEGLLDVTRTKVIERSRRGVANFKRPWWFPYSAEQKTMMRAYTALLGERRWGKRARAARALLASALKIFAKTPRL